MSITRLLALKECDEMVEAARAARLAYALGTDDLREQLARVRDAVTGIEGMLEPDPSEADPLADVERRLEANGVRL